MQIILLSLCNTLTYILGVRDAHKGAAEYVLTAPARKSHLIQGIGPTKID